MPESRSASLRVAHQRTCPNANLTSLDSLKGCTCKPSYYTSHRGPDGKPAKGARVRDRQVADRALRKLQVEIDEGRAGGARAEKITYADWADRYAAILEQSGLRGSTIRTYASTAVYGRQVFGSVELSRIGNDELRRFVAAIRKNKGGDAVVSKHLRHLSAMLEQAVEDGKLDANPVPRFRRRLKLTVPRGTPPYTDVELAALWAKLDALEAPGVYVAIVKCAVVTGARIGELIGLSWADVELSNRLLRIRHTWDPIDGMQAPKDGEERSVYLTGAAVAMLEQWTAAQGIQPDDAPVFSAPRSGGRIDQRYLHRLVDDALTQAKIAKAGENGRSRKPLHSLRASYSRILREAGVDPAFVQASLGHSTVDLTEQTYGTWAEVAMRKTADAVDEGRFPV